MFLPLGQGNVAENIALRVVEEGAKRIAPAGYGCLDFESSVVFLRSLYNDPKPSFLRKQESRII